MLDNTVVALRQPGNVEDPLTDLLREGARQLLAQAVEAEVADMLSAHDHLRTEDGRRRLVRHGHGPEREILTGIGPVPVRRAKLRDRGAVDPSARIRFTSARRRPGVAPAVKILHIARNRLFDTVVSLTKSRSRSPAATNSSSRDRASSALMTCGIR